MACAAIEAPIPRSAATFSWSPPVNSPPPYDFFEAFPAVHPGDPRATYSTRPSAGFYQGDSSRHPGPRRAAGNLSIPHLREALNSLDSKMASLLSEREVLECKLEQAVRLQVPVQRLPNELLASIFVIGVMGTEEEDALMLSTVMLVCRYWKEVAISCPILWSRVAAGTRHSLDKARRKLERSKSAPLHVSVDFSPRAENSTVTTESIARTMDLLRTSIWRWKSFRLTVPNRPQANAALRLCKEEAPLLETLSIRILHSMQDDHYSHAPLPIFNGRLPSIKSTSFTSFNFGWDISLLTGLRVLKLGGYWNGFSPSVDTILTILRNCPRLEELALRNMSDVDPDSCTVVASDPSEQDGFAERLVRVSDSRTIHLPRLSKASFYYSGILRTRTILSLLSFPVLERIELCFLDNVSPVIEHLRRQSLTSLPLKQMRIESSFFNELKLVRLLRRMPSLTTLELVDVEDASSNLLKVSLSFDHDRIAS
ncbi:hypothetical protein NLI96_g11659 [Meripilus lineatus]|uniref:F-box domain-containing protein n=1 Tax=Meripilus lineatus TaxID=2056292 RepID=A0AAD5URD3_9APHY|nr:hypothetical protein NLI96_g11659 [Physisporinus lineatus]